MKSIKNPGAKRLIFDILTFEDDVDSEGKKKRRDYFNKDHKKGRREAIKAITDTMEVGIVDEKIKATNITDIKEEDITYIPFKDFVLPAGKRAVVEKYNVDLVVEFTDKAVSAIKYYYKERDDLPDYGEEADTEIEELLK